MVRQTSTQGKSKKVDGGKEESTVASSNIVNVRIMRNEKFTLTSVLSIQLATNPKMCERIVRELRATNFEIQKLLDEIRNSRITWDMASLIIEMRSKMNRFSLVKSDCYWANFDTDLSETLALIDECHESLIGKFKEHFRLSDLLNIINTLETVQDRFEKKIEQIEEVLR